MNNNSGKIVLRLHDLLFEFLSHWKPILLAMILLGAAAGELRMYSYHNEVKNQYDETLIAKKEKYSEDTQNSLNTIASHMVEYELQIKKQNTYRDNSILMQMDWTSVKQLNIQYKVKLTGYPSFENLYLVLKSYEANLQSDNFFDLASASLNTSGEYISELLSISDNTQQSTSVSVYNGTDQTQITTQGDAQDSTKTDTGILTITIIGPSEEFCRSIENDVTTIISDSRNQIANSLAMHSIDLLSDNIITMSNESIQTKQLESLKKISDTETALQNLTKTLTGNDLRYVKIVARKQGILAGVVQDTPEPIKKHLVMSVAVGSLLGLILVLGYYLYQFVYGKTLRNEYLLSDSYQIPTYIKKKPDEKNPKGFSQFINKKRFSNTHLYSPVELQEILIADLENRKDSEIIHSLFIASNNLTDSDKTTVNQLTSALKQIGVEVTYGENILYHPEILKQVLSADGIILMETINSSLTEDINEEVRFLLKKNKKIIASIITI